MTAEALLSLRGDVALLVKAQDTFIIDDLVKAKKEQLGLIETLTMDTDSNGIVDESDLKFIKKSLFASF